MTTLITAIIETVVKSSVILGLTFVATLALRRQSAALRHTVWTAGLLSALALPLFSVVLPAWHVEPIRVVQSSPRVIAAQPVITESGAMVVSTPAFVPSASVRLTSERVLLLVWIIGVLSVASLLLREGVRLVRVAFGASAVQQSSWRKLAREISYALRLTRHVRLIRNPNASVLGTWGTLHPRVLLPRESESWSRERMRVVLGHELAHVKRNDWLVQIIAETARAIYWFNPLFWIACMQLCRESEHACDDAAMSLGGQLGMDGPTYAGHVLDLVRTLKHAGQPASAALAMASTSNLERRLIAMLNPSLNRRITGKRTAVIVAFLALSLTLPLAAVSSQAPMPTVSVTQTVEFAPPIPTAAIPAVTATPTVVQRALPRAVTAIATASPAAPAEAIPAPPAQNPTGTLSGTISDQTGAVLPGAILNMTAQSTGVIRRTVSNRTGSFAFTELPPDNYSVTVELPGFQNSALSYVLSAPGSSAKFIIPMRIAPMMTTVSITAQSPPGLKCFSIFGAFKSDGTPFTEADCPGGTVFVAPAKPTVAVAPEPATPEIISVTSPPAAIAAAGQLPIRVGGEVQGGNLLYHPSPAYPTEARNRGIQGAVILSAVIAEDGHIRSLKIISSSNPRLETSVVETIQSWIYKPTLLNKEPVETPTTITLNFTLDR